MTPPHFFTVSYETLSQLDSTALLYLYLNYVKSILITNLISIHVCKKSDHALIHTILFINQKGGVKIG